MLLKLAIGDAYGAGFEYAHPAFVKAHNGKPAYVQHPRHLGVRPGAYTDDTQMTLAVAETLLGEREDWSRETFARHFVEAFHRDPREGYARNFYAFLQEVRSGSEFLERIRPYSDKSGAAMRALPVGYLPDLAELRRVSDLQASLTHDTADGRASAHAAALMVHFFRHRGGRRAELRGFLEEKTRREWPPWEGKVGGEGVVSVRAALTALLQAESLWDLLQRCVAFTGDVDTVACIALGVGSECSELPDDLPGELVQGLEDGPYGRGYLIELQARLLARISNARLRA